MDPSQYARLRRQIVAPGHNLAQMGDMMIVDALKEATRRQDDDARDLILVNLEADYERHLSQGAVVQLLQMALRCDERVATYLMDHVYMNADPDIASMMHFARLMSRDRWCGWLLERPRYIDACIATYAGVDVLDRRMGETEALDSLEYRSRFVNDEAPVEFFNSIGGDYSLGYLLDTDAFVAEVDDMAPHPFDIPRGFEEVLREVLGVESITSMLSMPSWSTASREEWADRMVADLNRINARLTFGCSVTEQDPHEERPITGSIDVVFATLYPYRRATPFRLFEIPDGMSFDEMRALYAAEAGSAFDEIMETIQISI